MVSAFGIHNRRRRQHYDLLLDPKSPLSRCISSASSVKLIPLSSSFVGIHSSVGCLRKKNHPQSGEAPLLQQGGCPTLNPTRLQPANPPPPRLVPCRPTATASHPKPPPLASSTSNSGSRVSWQRGHPSCCNCVPLVLLSVKPCLATQPFKERKRGPPDHHPQRTPPSARSASRHSRYRLRLSFLEALFTSQGILQNVSRSSREAGVRPAQRGSHRDHRVRRSPHAAAKHARGRDRMSGLRRGRRSRRPNARAATIIV
jgi:hypothetical protein